MDSIKAPEFWPNDPELWFITLESQFLLNKPSPITNDDTKFSYIISLLPPSTAIDQLLTQEELGDRLPSQLLRRLRQLVGESRAVSDTTLKMLWMQRLPPNIQLILTTQEQASLNFLADLADRVTELTSAPSSSTSTLEKELASLHPEAHPHLENLPQTVIESTIQMALGAGIILDSSTMQDNDHIQHLHTIFKRLSDHGLTVNISKSVFGKPSLEFLGHIIDNKGIKPLTEKIRIVKDFPLPNSTRQLQRFIGLVNFITDHKSLAYAFTSKSERSPRQERHLNYLSLFSMDIRYVKDLTSLIGTNRIRTTAYNPAANGLVERLHRQIKAAIMASGNTINWIDALPLVLIAIRTSYKKRPEMHNCRNVVSRYSKTFTVKINNQDKVISVNRLKPAFIENTPQSFHDSSILPPMPYNAEETTPKTSSYTTRYERHVRFRL
ncbi:hypothetical protein LAZ67_2003023 [Cordylochernes scorpioides]|uniref:DUF7041 domain-containing protein n=1 Tax=Cordylochernes scorpioides TaxID=51811 RepID=A0ABY6K5W3_9ARAC|nr:hypothetical protein LAZ67_2003023 [Cordylochernes scorpioides]